MFDELALADAVDAVLPVPVDAAAELPFELEFDGVQAGKSIPTASTAAAAIQSLRFCIGDLSS
jgi:hypothetical protein